VCHITTIVACITRKSKARHAGIAFKISIASSAASHSGAGIACMIIESIATRTGYATIISITCHTVAHIASIACTRVHYKTSITYAAAIIASAVGAVQHIAVHTVVIVDGEWRDTGGAFAGVVACHTVGCHT
jgi:hypothetical protein